MSILWAINRRKLAKKNKPTNNKTTFTVPLAIMESLVSVKVPIPSSVSEVPNSITAIQAKIQFYRDNQTKATEDKKAKAELRIKALQAKLGVDADTSPQDSTSALEPTPELQVVS